MASATAALAAVVPIQLPVQIPLQIIGADNCVSWTPGGTAQAPTLTCVTGTPPPPGAPTCTLGVSPSSLPAGGGLVALNATCNNTDGTTTYAWGGPGTTIVPSTTASGQSVNVSQTTTFSVTATTGGQTGNTAQGTVTVAVATPVPTGAISCSGFANTRVVDMNWASPARMLTSAAGGMGPNDAVVVRFTTGSPSANRGSMTAAEYSSSPSARLGVLSDTPCDFGAGVQGIGQSGGNTVSVQFYVASQVPSSAGYYPVLLTQKTYYLNIMNVPNSSCMSSGNCDMYIDLSKP